MSLSAPAPPNPYTTANAQAGANRQSMADAAKYNDVNQVTPYGSLNYSGNYDDGTRTMTTSVSPEAQAFIDSQIGYSQNSANAASDRIAQANAMPAFSLGGLPGVRDGAYAPLQDQVQQTQLSKGLSYAPITDSFEKGQGVQYGIGDAGSIQNAIGPQGPIQTGIGGADAATRNNVESALYNRATSRLAPRFDRSRSALETRLTNQGITQGSDAYSREMSDFGQTENDAYQSAIDSSIIGGGQEQSRLFGLGVTQGQFANQAQQQGFEQALGSGQFGNDAQAQYFGQQATRQQAHNAAVGQDYSQNLNAANFSNQANMLKFGQNQAVQQFMNDTAGQQFGMNLAGGQFANDANMAKFGQNETLRQGDMQMRNQMLQEYLTGRNQPLNEAATLMGQSPGVQAPQFGGPARYSPQGVPIGDYIQQNYQTQSANRNAMISALTGMAGMGGAAMIMRPR